MFNIKCTPFPSIAVNRIFSAINYLSTELFILLYYPEVPNVIKVPLCNSPHTQQAIMKDFGFFKVGTGGCLQRQQNTGHWNSCSVFEESPRKGQMFRKRQYYYPISKPFQKYNGNKCTSLRVCRAKWQQRLHSVALWCLRHKDCIVYVRMCMYVCVHVCVCVYVAERERESTGFVQRGRI